MWLRGVGGVVLCLVGALWIAQGFGAAHGSPMTGHRQYAGLGAVLCVAGGWLLYLAIRAGRAKSKAGRTPPS